MTRARPRGYARPKNNLDTLEYFKEYITRMSKIAGSTAPVPSEEEWQRYYADFRARHKEKQP